MATTNASSHFDVVMTEKLRTKVIYLMDGVRMCLTVVDSLAALGLSPSASLNGVTCVITFFISLTYLRRCVSFSIVPRLRFFEELRASLLSPSSSSPTQFFNVKIDHFDFSLAPLLHRRFVLRNQRRVSIVPMTLRALQHAHWITTGLRRKVESSSASRPRLQIVLLTFLR